VLRSQQRFEIHRTKLYLIAYRFAKPQVVPHIQL
jgi:hypothetical protein